jgi:hypothetical protein
MVLGSTNEMGYRDLDGRPAEMARSTINTWVRRCKSCGYCAADLVKASRQASELVALTSYQEQLHNAEFPTLANEFLCRSMIFLEENLAILAFWDVMHAAWACDDAEMEAAADSCRAKAIDLLLENEKRVVNMMGADNGDSNAALYVDLLRRMGRFVEVNIVIKERAGDVRQEVVKDILAFQQELVNMKDRGVHHLGELRR